MRILLLAPVIFPCGGDLRYQGIERLASYWVGELHRLGHRVSMACATGSFLPRGVEYIEVPKGDFTQGEMVAYGIYGPRIREFDLLLDFSHSHWAMRERKLPAVCWVWHDPGQMQPPLPTYNVLALSQWQALRLYQFQKVNARVVDPHCGVGREPEPQAQGFCFIGRLTPTKNPLGAIDLCRQVGEPLAIIGDSGPGDPPEYVQKVKEQCRDGVTLWQGVADSIRDRILASSKALLHPLPPNYCEAHSHKTVDSLLSGCGVISYATGAMPEVIEHGVTGFLARDREEFLGYMLEAGKLDRKEVRKRALDRWSVERVVARALPLLAQVARGEKW